MKYCQISIRKTGVLFFVLLSVACPLFGDSAIRLGDNYASAGLYTEAITEYLRFLFYNADSPRKSEVFEKAAMAAFKQNDYPRFFDYMDQAVKSAGSPDERDRKLLLTARYSLAAGSFNNASNALKLLLAESTNDSAVLKGAFLLGVTLVYEYDWETASIMFEEYFQKTDTFSPLTEGRVLALLHYGVKASYKDAGLASMLSRIIPGAGQMYAGDFGQGVNSLAVTGLAGTLLVYSLVTYRFQDAIFSFLFVFQRFYIGSGYHGARIVNEKNKSKKQMIADGIFTLLLQDSGRVYTTAGSD